MCSESRQVGRANLFRGDALDILSSMSRASFGALLTDPPYCSGGNVRDRSAAPSTKYLSSGQRELYPEFSGDARDQRSFLAWSTLWLSRARDLLMPGALAVVFTDWRQLPVTTDALQCAGFVWRGVITWDKTESSRPQLGRYRNQAEFAVWGTNGSRRVEGAVAPGVFRHPVARTKLHIAGKPVPLMSNLLSIMDGPILDPFMGSGTIGMACRERSLDYTGIEIEPAYFEIACGRLSEAERPLSTRS